MRSVRRTELEASTGSKFQFQIRRACHALARVMRCLARSGWGINYLRA
jgi:hypothetical protein